MEIQNAITQDEIQLRVARWRHLFDEIPLSFFAFLLSRQGVYLELKTPDPLRLWRVQEACAGRVLDAKELHKLAAQTHLGKTIEEVLPEKLSKWRRLYFDEAVCTGEPQIYCYPHPFKGEEKYYRCRILPLLNPVRGRVEEVFVTVQDITIIEIPEFFVSNAQSNGN